MQFSLIDRDVKQQKSLAKFAFDKVLLTDTWNWPDFDNFMILGILKSCFYPPF